MKSFAKITAVVLVSVFLFALGNIVFAAEQTRCPVMGGKITFRLFSDYKEKRVFFCCSGCKPAFEREPEKYMKQLKEWGEEPMDISDMQ